jgi:hypothetical protein
MTEWMIDEDYLRVEPECDVCHRGQGDCMVWYQCEECQYMERVALDDIEAFLITIDPKFRKVLEVEERGNHAAICLFDGTEIEMMLGEWHIQGEGKVTAEQVYELIKKWEDYE